MTTREQEIEAVAQAIRSAWLGESPRAKGWLQIPERLRQQFRKEAAAAIGALDEARNLEAAE